MSMKSFCSVSPRLRGGNVLRTEVEHAKGFTLVELLVSLAFLSILAAISYSFARAALMSARIQEVRSEAQEVTTMALDIMVRELRMAGFNAGGATILGVRLAAADAVEVACDLNGDGDSADSNELVGYSYDANKLQLMRATAGGSPQPLVRNVPAGGLRLDYFDAAGAAVAAGRNLSAAGRSGICRIDVALRVELPNPDPLAPRPLTAGLTTSIALRNQCKQP